MIKLLLNYFDVSWLQCMNNDKLNCSTKSKYKFVYAQADFEKPQYQISTKMLIFRNPLKVGIKVNESSLYKPQFQVTSALRNSNEFHTDQ